MTERQRLQRVRELLAHYEAGCSPAAAWRKVNPGKEASDKSAADMFRRELRWLARWWLEEHPGAPALASDWWQRPKRCIGVDDRPCGKKIDRRQTRCTACTKEQRRKKRTDYNRNHHRSHKKSLNPKRNDRRDRAHQRELAAEAAAAKQKEEERRANMPRLIERNGKKYSYAPKTGEYEVLNRGDDGVWRWIPVPPRRGASQPGRAPRAGRRSSQQQNLAASSGKKRKAEANGGRPKRRCKTCAHPDRAAIEAELLQGELALRTIGGRHGISSSALHRHRSRHVKEPTVGDILEPVDKYGVWLEWDGIAWQRIAAPQHEYLKEVKGRPHDVRWRAAWSVDLNCAVGLKVYRRLGAK